MANGRKYPDDVDQQFEKGEAPLVDTHLLHSLELLANQCGISLFSIGWFLDCYYR